MNEKKFTGILLLIIGSLAGLGGYLNAQDGSFNTGDTLSYVAGLIGITWGIYYLIFKK